jgi:hypothetical protein
LVLRESVAIERFRSKDRANQGARGHGNPGPASNQANHQGQPQPASSGLEAPKPTGHLPVPPVPMPGPSCEVERSITKKPLPKPSFVSTPSGQAPAPPRLTPIVQPLTERTGAPRFADSKSRDPKDTKSKAKDIKGKTSGRGTKREGSPEDQTRSKTKR